MGTEDSDREQSEIAIVGAGLRFPGARSTEEYWRNLVNGVESIRTLSDAELAAAGVSASEYGDRRYIRRKGVLDGADEFDARFFELSPLEASVMDPQHRLFLECGWEALENAGYGGADRGGRVGVYTGVGLNTYWLRYVATNARVMELLGGWQASILNDKDFVPTRLSYHLDLKGPSVSVNSACSASLVAVHMACQSLLTYECDMALAGGVSVEFPQEQGLLWREGMVYAPDGHCRPFDAAAGGIVDGSGVGLVVLKRLADAVRDRDSIRGVILGSAVNNDGAAKVGYTAPSIEGQVDVVRQALAMAGCGADSIGYVEAHGTATALGDPIEVAALTQAFRESTQETGFCALGSVKSNVGHLDTAAGVAGLIKAMLCLEHRAFVPTLHFQKPNAHIQFEEGPFRVSADHRPWPEGPAPRRAGVTSLGIGGTNAHAIVEEAPPAAPSEGHRALCVFPISAKSERALFAMGTRLAAAVETGRDDLADVAYTLQVGRRPFEQRQVLVAGTGAELATALRAVSHGPVTRAAEQPPSTVFLFPGQGAQHLRMSAEIYESEPVYRRELDHCAELLQPRLDFDLRRLLLSTDPSSEGVLCETAVAQPALFIVEYALARLWSSWGVEPDAMIGHSVGELVAACLAGVLPLDEALMLVARRGALMARAPKGAMLAVNLAASSLADLLGSELSIAAINEPQWAVASGSAEAIGQLEGTLAARAIESRRLHTSHAFHSPAMDGVVKEFVSEVMRCTLSPPTTPFVSNVTGDFITSEQAVSPSYWGQHLRQTVRFSEGLGVLLDRAGAQTFVEVGPGQTLSRMVKRHPQAGQSVGVVSSLPHPRARVSEQRTLLEAAGALWLRGHAIDWHGFHAHEKLRRVPLPTYAFERRRHWVEEGSDQSAAATAARQKADCGEASLWLPSWTRRTEPLAGSAGGAASWLLVLDEQGVGDALAASMTASMAAVGAAVSVARLGRDFEERSEREVVFNPARPEQLRKLLDTLVSRGQSPRYVLHLAGLARPPKLGTAEAWESLASVSQLLTGLSRLDAPPAQLTVVANSGHAITGEEDLSPHSAASYALVRAGALEQQAMLCRGVDVTEHELERVEWLSMRLMAEVQASVPTLVAYRGRHRWEMTFEAVARQRTPSGPGLRPQGRYVVVGGGRDTGALVARHLCDSVGAACVLIDPSVPSTAAGSAPPYATLEARLDSASELSRALRQAEQRLGGLDGVVYAGASDAPCVLGPLCDLDVRAVASELGRSASVLPSLDSALQGRRLDFCLVLSSLSSLVGGAWVGGYAACSLLRDSFVRRHNQRGEQPWTLVSFQRWAAEASPARRDSLPAEQALRAIEWLAQHPELEQVAVAMGELVPALSNPVDASAPEDPGPAAVAEAAQEGPRRVPYVGPRDEAERRVATIWQELLGIARVGVDDDFFDLGGHSLLATRFLVRLEEALSLKISIGEFFSHPTVAELAVLCRDAELAATSPAELERLLTEMEAMSETDARAELETGAVPSTAGALPPRPE